MILGGIDNAYISPDEAGIDADYEAWWSEREALEWPDSAESEPGDDNETWHYVPPEDEWPDDDVYRGEGDLEC